MKPIKYVDIAKYLSEEVQLLRPLEIKTTRVLGRQLLGPLGLSLQVHLDLRSQAGYSKIITCVSGMKTDSAMFCVNVSPQWFPFYRNR